MCLLGISSNHESLKRVPVPLSAWSCRHVRDWMSERESRESSLCFPEIAAAGGGGRAGREARQGCEWWQNVWPWGCPGAQSGSRQVPLAYCHLFALILRQCTQNKNLQYRVSRRDSWDIADCVCFVSHFRIMFVLQDILVWLRKDLL